jgi:hypothetical protein
MPEDRPFLNFKAIKGRVAIADVLARYRITLVRVNQTSVHRSKAPVPCRHIRQEAITRFL